jgi:hypothetical protein
VSPRLIVIIALVAVVSAAAASVITTIVDRPQPVQDPAPSRQGLPPMKTGADIVMSSSVGIPRATFAEARR